MILPFRTRVHGGLDRPIGPAGIFEHMSSAPLAGGVYWTVKTLGTKLSIILGIPALSIAAYLIWLRYRDDEL